MGTVEIRLRLEAGTQEDWSSVLLRWLVEADDQGHP